MKKCSKCSRKLPLKHYYGRQTWCKDCVKAYQREYRAKNGDRIRAYQRLVKVGRVAEAKERYGLRNQAPRERRVRARIPDGQRSRPQDRPHARFSKSARTNARNRGSNGGRLTVRTVSERIAYWGHRCAWCKTGPVECLDHVIPVACGGQEWPANVRPSCLRCNERRQVELVKRLFAKASLKDILGIA